MDSDGMKQKPVEQLMIVWGAKMVVGSERRLS